MFFLIFSLQFPYRFLLFLFFPYFFLIRRLKKNIKTKEIKKQNTLISFLFLQQKKTTNNKQQTTKQKNDCFERDVYVCSCFFFFYFYFREKTFHFDSFSTFSNASFTTCSKPYATSILDENSETKHSERFQVLSQLFK